MDVSNFFTRLLQAPKAQSRIKQPDDISDFDAAWTGIQETLEHPDERQLSRGITATPVPAQIKHIVDALVYEGNRTDEDTTGACLEYFLKNDLLANLERLCEADRPYGIKGEVVRAINNLIVLLSERFLVHNAVHRPLRRLLRSCIGDEPEEKVDTGSRVFGAAGVGREGRDDELDADLVDLMCILCSRMRAYPPLLLIFFHDKGWLQTNPSAIQPFSSTSSSRSQTISNRSKQAHHFEFLLFSYLLRFIHREGRTGDFARAGLLFLFDIAFLASSDEGGDNLSLPVMGNGSDPLQDVREALGEYILDGDFADVMAAGLGALWSLLPTKLRVPGLAEMAAGVGDDDGITASTSGGMHLGTTVEGEDNEVDLPLSTELEVRGQLDLLLKLFGFLQDIIHRCSTTSSTGQEQSDGAVSTRQMLGSAIVEATVEAITLSFLENVLYPSILECAPHDGSAVAVMTYLDVVLSNLDDGPLLRRMINFLLGTPGDQGGYGPEGDITRTTKREYYEGEGRFTLKDLIIDNIASTSPVASTAAYRLLYTLLSDRCRYAARALLGTIPDITATSHSIPMSIAGPDTVLPLATASLDPHLQETELYGSLIARIEPTQVSADQTGYSTYLLDMHETMQTDPCFIAGGRSLRFLDGGGEPGDLLEMGYMDLDPFQHRLNPSDPLLRRIMLSLEAFFSQEPDVNVALTGTITALCQCPNRSLLGWLLYDLPADDDPWAKQDRSNSISRTSMSPSSTPRIDSDPFTIRSEVELPAIYQILRTLVRQINHHRLDIDDFDRLLSERRQGLLFADHLDEAMNIMLEVDLFTSTLPTTPGPSPATPLGTKKSKKSRPSLAGSIESFLTPKRNKSTSTMMPVSPGLVGGESPFQTPGSVSMREEAGRVSNSPFRSHYERTGEILLDTPGLGGSMAIPQGVWSPGRVSESTRSSSRMSQGQRSGEAALISGGEEVRKGRTERNEASAPPEQVTLSRLLDNCVILEDFLKEIVSIITIRRTLGIDQVGYV